MKFAMGAETLTVLTKQTSSANEDLGSLVKQLFAAAEPIQGKFNGAGRAAFDKFKGEIYCGFAEKDHLAPPETIEILGKLMKARDNVNYRAIVHAGTVHGYSLRRQDV